MINDGRIAGAHETDIKKEWDDGEEVEQTDGGVRVHLQVLQKM